jgi:ubiquinone/menaquinone biosynthesis C-methylase UbiE
MSASPAVEGSVRTEEPIRRNGTVERNGTGATRMPRYLEPGASTAVASNVSYRLGKLRAQGVLHGSWLDCGCASGGYTIALARHGADEVIGLDLEADRIARAQAERPPDLMNVSFACASSEELPFPDERFDGVLLNEVLEHVGDERATLAEIRRVLRPGGVLALMSPNRYFPFEGHGMRLGSRSIDVPVPVLPWLPSALAMRYMRARNYWPGELQNLVRQAGFEIVTTESIFPVFEVYPWLPAPVVRRYREAVPRLETLPFVRRFGVSTFVLGRRGPGAP